jgi:hypothetical protein
MPQNIISLSIGRDSWLATYRGPHAAEIIELFGTDTIPTAFTPAAPLSTVRDFIRSKHPGATIIARPIGG